MFLPRFAPAALIALAACASLPARPDDSCPTTQCAAPTRRDIRSLETTGQSRQAWQAAERRTQLFPDSADAWLDLARTAATLHRHDQVLGAYHHFVALRPDEPRGHELLGWAFLEAAQPDSALPEMRTAVRLAPDRAESNAGVGYALAALQRNEEALRAFAAATKLAPDDAETWGQMATIAMALTREADALRYWDQALRAQPGYFDTRPAERRAWEVAEGKAHGAANGVAQAGEPAAPASSGAARATGTLVSAPATAFRIGPDDPTSSGSGFVVSREGLVLTNKHVIRGCANLKVRNDSSTATTAHVVAIDPDNDLALLSSGVTAPTVAVFRAGGAVRRGEDVVAVGYPLSGLLADQVNVSPGSVNALAGMYNDPHQLQMSAPVQPGSSGGPLLDASGNVVGIVVTKLNAKVVADAMGDIPQNVNFALKSSVAETFLAANGVAVQSAPSSTVRTHADVGEIGRRVTVLVECWR